MEKLKVCREGLLDQGFRALQIYRFGHDRFRFKSILIRWPWGVAQRVRSKLSEILFGIEIGVKAAIGRRLVIEHFGSIVIHGATVIGGDCAIRQGVTLGKRFLDQPLDGPKIGSRVNAGAEARVLGNVVIGDNLDIGANAVVVTDIPSFRFAAGVPALIKLKKSYAI